MSKLLTEVVRSNQSLRASGGEAGKVVGSGVQAKTPPLNWACTRSDAAVRPGAIKGLFAIRRFVGHVCSLSGRSRSKHAAIASSAPRPFRPAGASVAVEQGPEMPFHYLHGDSGRPWL